MRKLYSYQKSVVRYLKDTPKAALYAEMRLGKTLCTIRALKDFPGRKLIVCPKSVIHTWLDELEMEGITDYVWFSSEFLKRYKKYAVEDIVPPQWFVLNYEAVMRLPQEFKDGFNAVIVDESAKIKEPRAKITKFFLNNFENVERKILLSGNPAPNNPLEYFTQMQFLHGKWMRCDNYWQFRKRYFVSDLQGWQWWTRHSSKDVIKIELQKTCYFLSRKDVGVENRKVYEKRYVEMPTSLEREYRRMEKEFVVNLPDGTKLETKYVLPKLTYLQEMASGHCVGQKFSNFKIKELVSLLEGELKNEQVLVWCRFRWEINAIQQALRGLEIKPLWIHGDIPLPLRRKAQESFNRKDTRVLILQTATSKYGLNLSVADTSIYFSNTFVADDRNQSEMRIEANEKKTPLLYIDLVTKNSVDEDILKALERKKKDSQYFMERVVQNIKERHSV